MSKRYEIREQIGKGGLGAVFKALDTQLQREVAIKRVLSTDQGKEEEVKEAAAKLIAEAQTLSSLNHPNIVTVFDVGQDEEGGFVVMELLKGETLDETVSRGVLTQEDFTEVVYQTMEALIAAQANNVIHRDIKPTNIMVIWQASGKFQLKILDFGLAKFSKAPSVQTMDQEESVMGSIFFMAPEQFERGELDSRTDLYQMGCVYYNALTGQYPFNGETAPQVMNAHLQHRVIPLEQVRPDLSPSICQWVMWLINRDIGHRPKDARDALKHWPRNPEPPGAKPLEVLPVEDTPEVSTGEVTVVRAARGASAPPALVVVSDKTGSAPVATLVTGSTTGRLKTGSGSATGAVRSGSTTGRLEGKAGKAGPGAKGAPSGRAGATGPVSRGGGKANVKRTPEPGGGGKMKWIAIGSALSAVVLFAVFKSVGKAKAEQRRDRIIALSSDETPTGDLSDVALAVAFLADPKSSPSIKSDASKVLERLEGVGISERVHEELRKAGSLPLKMRLAQALAERNYTPAAPDLIGVFRAATSDDQRIQVLQAVRALATMRDMDAVLGALHGDQSLPVRRVLEDTALAVLRKGGDTEKVIDGILAKLEATSDNERRSLFRILGILDGPKVEARLAEIFSGGSPDLQRDAINAYLNWPNRSVLAQVEGIAGGTGDDLLRTGAERAYIRLVGLPGSEPVEEMLPLWRKAYEFAQKSPKEFQSLVASLVDFPAPETLALMKEWESHASLSQVAKNFASTLEKTMQGLPELKPGEELKGNKARVRGDRGASVNSFLSSLTGWISPETFFTWHFTVAEGGDYLVEIDQSSMRDEPSEFLVQLAGVTQQGESKRTPSLDDFETVRVGETVSLQPGTIYSLTIMAGKTIQPRMMDIGAIRLVKP
jgi:serine/threonine protein kinase